MAYKQLSPLPVEQGGTNTSSFPFDHGVLVFEAGQQISINPSINGYVLTSNGPALPPTFQAIDAHGALVEMTADTGSAVPLVGVIDLAGGSNINTSATGNTVTVNLDNTISVSGSITAGTGLNATTGGANIVGNVHINNTSGNVGVFAVGNSSSGAVEIVSGTASSINILAGDGLNISSGNGTGTGSIYMYTAGATGTIQIDTSAGSGDLYLSTAGSSVDIGSDVTITVSGSLLLPSFTSYGALVSDTLGTITDAASTAGYVLTGNSGAAPSFQALPSTPAYITWVDQTITPLIMAPNHGYVMDDGINLITATLPVAAILGSTFTIQGFGSGLFTIAQNLGQTIHFGAISTTTGIGGSLSSNGQYDSVTLVCVKTNTDFAVMASVGNLSWV